MNEMLRCPLYRSNIGVYELLLNDMFDGGDGVKLFELLLLMLEIVDS